MSSEETRLWRRAGDLFELALEEPEEERLPFIERVCASDTSLLDAVRRLLREDSQGKAMLQRPVTRPAFPSLVPVAGEGTRIGPYRLVRALGEGGTGRVFLAQRVEGKIDQKVALKLIREDYPRKEILRLLQRERRILARLEHPNIARFLDTGSTPGGTPYFVMEYVDGERIDHHCDGCRLPVDRRLELFVTVCGAVEHAHRRLIIHRDLKPGNILVSDEGAVKLLDFGTAKPLDASPRAGEEETLPENRFLSLHSASPEQLAGEPMATATDIFSLGILLYRLLTGCLPFDLHGKTAGEAAEVLRSSSPKPPSEMVRSAADGDALAAVRSTAAPQLRRRLKGDLDNIVLKCLRPEPADRYGSVGELAEDCSRSLRHLPVSARPPGPGDRLVKFARRNTAAVTVSAAAAVALVVLSTLHYVSLTRERDKALQARLEAEQISSFLTDAFRLSNPYETYTPTAGRRRK